MRFIDLCLFNSTLFISLNLFFLQLLMLNYFVSYLLFFMNFFRFDFGILLLILKMLLSLNFIILYLFIYDWFSMRLDISLNFLLEFFVFLFVLISLNQYLSVCILDCPFVLLSLPLDIFTFPNLRFMLNRFWPGFFFANLMHFESSFQHLYVILSLFEFF